MKQELNLGKSDIPALPETSLNKTQLRKIEIAQKRAIYQKQKAAEQAAKKHLTEQRIKAAKEGCVKLRNHSDYRQQVHALMEVAKPSSSNETLSLERQKYDSLVSKGAVADWLLDSLYLIGIVVKISANKIVLLKSRLMDLYQGFTPIRQPC